MKRVWTILFAAVALGELMGRYQKSLVPWMPMLVVAISLARLFACRYMPQVFKIASSLAGAYGHGDCESVSYARRHAGSGLGHKITSILNRLQIQRGIIYAAALCLVLGNCRMLVERFFYEEWSEGRITLKIRNLVTQTSELDELAQAKSSTWRCRVDWISPRTEGYLVKSGQVNIYCDEGAAELKIGNEVEFTGQISRIASPRNPGEWDYAASSMASGITHRLYAKEIAVIDDHVSWAGQKLYELRTFLLNRISASFPGEDAEDDAAFLRAALLGDKSLMSDEMYDMYRSNGIAHLLAISGLHVSIIGMSLYRSIRKAVLKLYRELYIKRHPLEELLCIEQGEAFLLPDLVAGACSVVFLIFYSILTGSSVSTVRAAFMMILMFLASINCRTYDLLSAAAMAGLCIILYRPYQLFSCSFLLSFGAVAAIGGPASYITKRYGIRNSVVSSIVVSLCIQLVTLPIASAFFFEISTYGLFLNLLVIPLMTYVVWSGIASLIIPAAGGGAHYLLKFFTWLCSLTEPLPARSILLGRPTVLLTSLLTLLTPLKPADSITFLDVGQGDGIYLNLAGEDILVDAGSSSSKSMGKYTLEPFLKSSRVSSLDRVFVTHADQDHISGVRYLLTESDIEIERLYLPVQALEDSAYDSLKAEAEAAGTKLIYLKQGDVVLPGGGGNGNESEPHKASSNASMGRCRITCLWPTEETSTEDMNNESLVLLLKDGDFTAYLAGDAGQEAEAEIIERYSEGRVTAIFDSKIYDNVDSHAPAVDGIDLLKCGHHGSSTSTSAELLEALKPRKAVLSYKEGNRYGHPHKEVLERLEKYDIETLHTARSGAVTFMLTGRRVIVKTYIGLQCQNSFPNENEVGRNPHGNSN